MNMDRTEIEQTIRRILASSQIGLEADAEETPLSACDLSSLAWLRLMIDLENAFGIELDLQEAGTGDVPTLHELVRYVESELDGR